MENTEKPTILGVAYPDALTFPHYRIEATMPHNMTAEERSACSAAMRAILEPLQPLMESKRIISFTVLPKAE